MEEIRTRLARLRTRIGAALERAGDPSRPVTIVAVTKQCAAPLVDAVAAAGLLDVGENRVQEAEAKAPQVRAAVRWHLIGHLQTNKARRAAELFSVVHSVDSERVLLALAAAGRPLEVFLQVNVSGEGTKSGISAEGVRGLYRAAAAAVPLRVVGLMTMAPFSEDPGEARPHFRALRQIRDDLEAAGDGPPLPALSMGMSGDFEVALEEGATHIRIGTALVGGIPPEDR